MSAVLLPFSADGSIDWAAFEAHVERTAAAGLTPAVNMDTGYVQLLSAVDRARVLDVVRGSTFVGGAFVDSEVFELAAVVAACQSVAAAGGTPVVLPSPGLARLSEDEWVAAMAAIGREVDAFIGFELGPMFVPYGRIVSLDAYRGLLEVPTCVGAKHSSLSRALEWERLAVRDAVRPDFMVLTGNDLAIDMVMWGSDYLLGLSTFAPDVFALRDRAWAAGDPSFFELNDVLQYLGMFAFRDPVPAYRHDAAMFLELRGWAPSDATPSGVPRRPSSDREVLRDIVDRLPS